MADEKEKVVIGGPPIATQRFKGAHLPRLRKARGRFIYRLRIDFFEAMNFYNAKATPPDISVRKHPAERNL